ncbi:MAG TPA: chemotaxis protein CheW [Myxococcota bacterium]
MSAELFVIFKVGEAELIISAADVLEMESFRGATRVPGAQAHVVGLVQIRGRVIPVLDLRERFGLPPIERGLDARVIVVKDGDRQVGLLADSAREVRMLDPAQFTAPPSVVLEQTAGFVTAIAQAGPRMFMRVDFQQILNRVVVVSGGDTPVLEREHGQQA